MSKYPLLNYINSASKNILWEVGNGALLGIPEALKTTISDTYTQSKMANDALYYLQVKTFLETVNLSYEEVSQFMNENPDHQRLGLEIFKILEQTTLEHQARMIAKAFNLYTKKDIQKQEFDKYTYIITRLNNHLILLIDELYIIETNRDDPELVFDISNANMEFVNFQFLIEVPSPLNLDGKIKISRFKRTENFYYFYKKIFKD